MALALSAITGNVGGYRVIRQYSQCPDTADARQVDVHQNDIRQALSTRQRNARYCRPWRSTSGYPGDAQ
jgi:hypothetical protein